MSDRTTMRTRELAAIHCAKRDLGLDDETYRGLLQTVASVESSKDLDEDGRRRVLDRMRELGASKGKPSYPGRPHNIDTKLQLAKVEALLAEQALPWSYAHAIAKQMFRISRVQWLDTVQLAAVITALVKRGEKEARKAAAALEAAKPATTEDA